MSYRKKRIVRRASNGMLNTETLMPGFPAFVSKVLSNRGIHRKEEMDFSLEALEPPNFLHIDKACGLLSEALINGESILIIGDYDADGATSTALAVTALKSLGAAKVDYLVPNRFDFGYGLSPEIVEVAVTKNPDLIVTVDSGISCCPGVALAKSKGIKVLVTDHHLPGQMLPDADAIVNPNQMGCEFSSKNTAGVGVIFYVLCALRTHLKSMGWFTHRGLPEPNMANWLDLVALGTVADVVRLDRNNRILVQKGVERIRKGRTRPGIMMLLKVAGKDYRSVVSSDLGFSVGPRLNAAGRLDDMTIGIECLISEDWQQAEMMASMLNEYNLERRQLEQEMLTLSEELVTGLAESGEQPWGVSLFDPGFHQGIIGLVASRVKDRIHRPVFVFAPSEDGSELKGSGRGIPGIHLRDSLERISSLSPGLIRKFGGHAAAAGLSIVSERFCEFRQLFDGVVRNMLSVDDLQPVVLSDGELSADELSMENAHRLRELAPWGQGFPEPVFDGEFDVVSSRIVGTKHLKLLVQPGASPGTDLISRPVVEAIQFNSPLIGREIPRRLRLAYRMDINHFRGADSLQLLVDYVEPV